MQMEVRGQGGGEGAAVAVPMRPSLPKGRRVQEQDTATSARAWGDIWACTRVCGHTQGCRAQLWCPEGEHAGIPCCASTYVHAGVTVCMQLHTCAIGCMHSWYFCSHQGQGGGLLESMPEHQGRGPGLQGLHTALPPLTPPQRGTLEHSALYVQAGVHPLQHGGAAWQAAASAP